MCGINILNLTPFQGDSLQWDVFPGVKTPGLRTPVPLGQNLRRPGPLLHPKGWEHSVGGFVLKGQQVSARGFNPAEHVVISESH